MKKSEGLRMKVKYWRTRRAMTVRALAEKAAVSSATIVRIERENGLYIPQPAVINKLAVALSVDIDMLLVDEEAVPAA